MAFSSTTFSSAVSATANFVVVASATGFAAQRRFMADGEMFEVTKDYVSGTTVNCLRGLDGTPQRAHDSGANVVVGLASDFPQQKRFGYESGSGNTVTQLTNRTTGVTLHALTGQITTNTASLAAEGTAKFTVTNAFVAEDDTVVLSQRSGSNSGGTLVDVTGVGDGSFEIAVHNGNVAAGTAETGAIVISFSVIKAQRA